MSNSASFTETITPFASVMRTGCEVFRNACIYRFFSISVCSFSVISRQNDIYRESFKVTTSMSIVTIVPSFFLKWVAREDFPVRCKSSIDFRCAGISSSDRICEIFKVNSSCFVYPVMAQAAGFTSINRNELSAIKIPSGACSI